MDRLWLKLGCWVGVLTDSLFLGAIIQELSSDSCPLELILESWVLSFEGRGSCEAYLKADKPELTLLISHKKPVPEAFYFRKLPSSPNLSLTLAGNYEI